MKNVPESKLGNLYREHIKLILKKDISGLLNQYAEDGILVSSFEKTPKYFRGHSELEKHFEGIKDLRKKLEQALTVTDGFGRDARSIMNTLGNIKDPQQLTDSLKENSEKIKVLK